MPEIKNLVRGGICKIMTDLIGKSRMAKSRKTPKDSVMTTKRLNFSRQPPPLTGCHKKSIGWQLKTLPNKALKK